MRTQNTTQQPFRTRSFRIRCATLFASAFLVLTLSHLQAQDVLMGLASDGGIEGKGTIYSIRTDTKAFNVIKGFADWGQSPKSDLLLGPDGNYYGMTPQGGTYGYGTIFRITPKGEMTIIKHFDVKPDGGSPNGSLILGKDGNFYGLTSNGGLYWGGVIFRLTPSGHYSVLRSFNTGVDGYSPQGRLVQDADGNFYGLTSSGGAKYNGTIFKYNASTNAYTVLWAFNGNTEGGKPEGSLVQGSDNAFYGMARIGGTYNSGVVFRISGTSYSVIRHLNGTTDGRSPRGNLIKATDNFLYGMTPDGGANYNGTIFKINNTGTSFNVLKAMSSSLQGGQPYGSLLQASDGNFYGTAYTIYGGYSGCIFKLTANGTTLSVVKKFTRETEGSALVGSLIQGADGLLYGMAQLGGKYNSGTLYKTTTSGTTFTMLGHFNGAAEGNVPQEGLVIGKDSAYFGVTQYGGTYGNGTVFKMCGGVVTVLKSFDWTPNGAKPQGGLVRGKDGNLYGMTGAGGTYGGGTIYKVVPGTGLFSVIRHLKPATDGGSPQGILIEGPDGFLYGMAFNGGINSAGTIFKINTSGTVFNVLRHLAAATDGTNPQAGLTYKDGFFYGMTGGSSTRFFKISPDGTTFNILKTLNSGTEGYNPAGNMIVGTDGALYGTLQNGGTYNGGSVFRITTGGVMTVLKALSSATDGASPKGGLVQGSDGAFYGTTSIGGINKAGTIFRVTTAKAFSILRSLNIATDGGTPLGGLVIAPKVVLVANPQSGLTTAEDIAKAITLTGSGAPNLTFAVTTRPRHGVVSTGTGAARTYTPRANFYGVDSFAFVSSLGCLSSAPAWVKINVTPVNDTPKLAPIGNRTVVKGNLLTFTVTANDPDPGQTKTFSLISAPGGAAIGAFTGIFNWTPTATGTFTFKVRVTDNGSPVLYSEQSVTVTVTATTLMGTTANELTVNKTAEEKLVSVKSKLYPTVVTAAFTLEFGAPVQQVLVTIADLKGVVVYSRIHAVSGRQLQLDATPFSAGQYFVQVQSTQGTEVLKFVKR